MDLPNIVHMSPEDWADLPDNPRQRDTEKHAKKALRNHLAKPAETHSIVHAAEVSGVGLVKLDGHTRSYLWQEGLLEPPGDRLTVIVHRCASLAEAAELYSQYDNRHAAENAIDLASGALREQGIPATPYLQYGLTSALQCATGQMGKQFDVYSAAAMFRDELLLITEHDFQKRYLPAGCLAAMLLTLRRYSNMALGFWLRVQHDQGVKTARGRDAVEQLRHYIDSTRGRGGGVRMIEALCAKALAAFEGDRRGHIYTSGLRGLDIDAYRRKCRIA